VYLGKSSSESGKLASGGDDSVKLDFGLTSSELSEDAKKAWGYDFSLVYSVTLARDGLQTMLNVQNKGEKALEFQMLLHTYFRIDVSTITTNRAEALGADLFAGHLKSRYQRARKCDLHRQSPQRNRAPTVHALPPDHWRSRPRLQRNKAGHHLDHARRQAPTRRDPGWHLR